MKKLVWCLIIFSCVLAKAQTPSQREVYQEIIATGIKYPDIALAQAILESGHFKSKIAKQNNNFFGMRVPKRRHTTAVGQRSGYARYLSWQDSVEDYKIWQHSLFKRNRSMTKDQFKEYLNRMYSTSSNYIAKINTIITKNKSKYEKDHYDRDSVRNNLNDSLWISSN